MEDEQTLPVLRGADRFIGQCKCSGTLWSSATLITGVGKIDDRLVILLNADSILTVDEKMALSSIDAAASDSVAP